MIFFIIHLHTFPDIPIPNISISSTTHMISGLSIAALSLVGQRLQLTCNVMVLEHLVVTPSVLWTGINLPTDETGNQFTNEIVFSAVQKSDIGPYVCHASVTINLISITINSTKTIILGVEGMLIV